MFGRAREKNPYDKQMQETRYLWYVREMKLAKLIESNHEMSVCVVGSGNGYFGEELLTRYPRMKVTNIDPAMRAYETVEGAQHRREDSLRIGAADNSFDLVVSYQSFPKYYEWRLESDDVKEALMRSPIANVYSYHYSLPDADMEGVMKNVYLSIKEFLRVTKNGGAIKFMPVEKESIPFFKMCIEELSPKSSCTVFSDGIYNKSYGLEIVKFV